MISVGQLMVYAFLLIILLFFVPLEAQELSLDVFPSEDELLEALNQEEISYSRYQMLQEISRHSLDSNSNYLLDEIPNLSFFNNLYINKYELSNPTEEDQEQPFLNPDSNYGEKPVSGLFSYRELHDMDERGQSWYRMSTDIRLYDNFKFESKVDKEQSGYQRVVKRSLSYNNDWGLLRKVTIGNYTTRFGLGTQIGYRGKLLSLNRELNLESIAYPDYGGMNGFYLQAQNKKLIFKSATSIVRDKKYKHLISSISAGFSGSKDVSAIILSYNLLENRLIDRKVEIPAFGAYYRKKYSTGYTAFEFSTQVGAASNGKSIIVEGRHRFNDAEMKYAGWLYSDGFLDLASGSKAGILSRTDTIATIDFSYNSRRTGQVGGLIRTEVQLSNSIQFANSYLYASYNKYHYRHQLLTSVVKDWNRRFKTELSIFVTDASSGLTSKVAERKDYRIQLQGRAKLGDMAIRSYLAYHSELYNEKYFSAFMTVRYYSQLGGMLQLWSQFNKFGSEEDKYRYFFLRGEQLIGDFLTAGVKISLTYHGNRINNTDTQVSFDLKANI